MNKNIIVHFGAGALGRGLVVPLLYQSGYKIVLIDTNKVLNKELNSTHSYIVDISDEVPDKRKQEIKIIEAISPVNDNEKVKEYLKKANIITTSVRRENLIHVARTIVDTWGNTYDENRMIICCENVENVGTYFKKILIDLVKNEEQKRNIENIRVPDTIVDRICSTSWPESSVVTSEIFHECAVDVNIIADTKIELIPSVRNIEAAFLRKRLLVNTYADAVCFIALKKGKTYLYEAVQDTEINCIVEPYINLLKKLLEIEYGYNKAELDKWSEKYKKRLGNSEIPRKIDSVARNLWAKLSLEERFMFPLIKLIDHNVDISVGVDFLARLIQYGIESDIEKLNKDEIKEKLRELWCINTKGKDIYEKILNYL